MAIKTILFWALISLFSPSSHYVFAGNFTPSECPEGKSFVEIINFDKKLYISPYIKSFVPKNLLDEMNLPTRDDGLFAFSSETNFIGPGSRIRNCLPYGVYTLYVEYYRTAVPLTGNWLVKIEEGQIFNFPKVTKFETDIREPEFNEYLYHYGPLLAIYITTVIVFIIAIIIAVKELIKKRRVLKIGQ